MLKRREAVFGGWVTDLPAFPNNPECKEHHGFKAAEDGSLLVT